eukprot:Clim_evm44s215 gene=Clim_evmTU44s215
MLAKLTIFSRCSWQMQEGLAQCSRTRPVVGDHLLQMARCFHASRFVASKDKTDELKKATSEGTSTGCGAEDESDDEEYIGWETKAKRFEPGLEAFPDDINPKTKEEGGPRGPEPTRFGDWERKGRVTDF